MLLAPPSASAETVEATADALRERALNATPEERQRTIQASMVTMVRNEALRAEPSAQALASDRQVAAQAFHELIVTDLRPYLGRITAPTKVLYVKAPNVPLDEQQLDALYNASYAPLVGAVLKRIPNSYHFIMYDQPATFARELGLALARI